MRLVDTNVVMWIDYLISTAIKEEASDIHIEPFAQYARIRIRKNGDLVHFQDILASAVEQVVLRLQVLARIDTTQKRLPHDGKFVFSYDDRMVDIRVSSFPVLYGQKIVLRILDNLCHQSSIAGLGFSLHMEYELQQLLTANSGLLLVTGPTGSGKTTTLYTLLQQLHADEKNIVTLEDPIEYSLPGIMQSAIIPEIGFDFAQGIRSLLRQDPDIIMVGEIRDLPTARAAIEAALTGHLVLGTMHTIDAPSAIIRLMDMGIEPYLLRATLLAVVAQRLVKRLCVCAENSSLYENFADFPIPIDGNTVIASAKGCAACDQTGYKRRIGIFELLLCNEVLKSEIRSDGLLMHIISVALKQGWKPLVYDAAQKLLARMIDYHNYKLALTI